MKSLCLVGAFFVSVGVGAEPAHGHAPQNNYNDVSNAHLSTFAPYDAFTQNGPALISIPGVNENNGLDPINGPDANEHYSPALISIPGVNGQYVPDPIAIPSSNAQQNNNVPG